MFDQEALKRICEEGPEIMLYFAINELGGFSFHMRHEMYHERIPLEDQAGVREDVKIAQSEIEFAVDHCTRFGVATPRENGHPTDEYLRWFRWWDSYVKGLSPEKWAELDSLLTRLDGMDSEELKKWRPEGDWKMSNL